MGRPQMPGPLTKEEEQPMANKFQVGDVVKLNAGGPDMSVYAEPQQQNEWYRCQWFAGKKLENGSFKEAELELVKKKS